MSYYLEGASSISEYNTANGRFLSRKSLTEDQQCQLTICENQLYYVVYNITGSHKWLTGAVVGVDITTGITTRNCFAQ